MLTRLRPLQHRPSTPYTLPAVAVALIPPTLIFVVFLYQRWPIYPLRLSDYAGLLFRWQTLVAGCLAIEAAAIGGFFIAQQIYRDNRAEREARTRRLQAELASLPMVLSDLMDYLLEVVPYVLKLRNIRSNPNAPATIGTLPELDRNIVVQIRRLVEEGGEDVAETARILLRTLQVFDARLRQLSRTNKLTGPRTVVPTGHTDVLADAAELYAMVSVLFPFARAEVDSNGRAIPPSVAVDEKKITSGMITLFWDQGVTDDVRSMVSNGIERKVAAAKRRRAPS